MATESGVGRVAPVDDWVYRLDEFRIKRIAPTAWVLGLLLFLIYIVFVRPLNWIARDNYGLRLESTMDVGEITTTGESLIVVASVGDSLHFRTFDGAGRMVVDTDETKLGSRAEPIDDLWGLLEGLWPPHKLTQGEKDRVIVPVASILLSQQPKNPTLFWTTCSYWLPLSTVVAVVLIVAGRLGGRLGLSGLFRDPLSVDPGRKAGRPKGDDSPPRGGCTAFLGALGATILIAEVWTIIYYLEVIEHLDKLGTEYLEKEDFKRHRDLLAFLEACCPPFLGLLLLAGLFPTRAAGIERRRSEFARGSILFALGIALGCIIIVLSVPIGGSVHLHEFSEWAWDKVLYPVFYHVSFQDYPWLKIEDVNPYLIKPHPGDSISPSVLFMASYSGFLATVLLIYGVIFVLQMVFKNLSPGLGVCIIFSYGVTTFALLTMLSSVGHVGVLLFLFFVLVCTNGNRYKYRFPGMDDYYREGGHVTQAQLNRAREDPAKQPEPPLLDNLEVLECWKRLTGLERPKLVLVATTGGAYRAAFWTTTVLDEIGRCLGESGVDFHRHVRLITGASGGMVGAAYYVRSFDCDLRLMSSASVNGIPGVGENRIVVAAVEGLLHFRTFDGAGRMVVDTDETKLGSRAESIDRLRGLLEGLWPPHELTECEKARVIASVGSIVDHTPRKQDVTDSMRKETGLDSLSPVVRQLVFGDLPGSFLPRPQKHDRGIELEQEWKSLAKKITDLSFGEREGWRPSLVVSPMILENGRRLLISNLDLGSLAETRPFAQAAAGDGEVSEAQQARLYSSPAVEFFRVFPRARASFSLQTAIRMSATFPLASPAVSLPTDPPRRVVDAGYYDNYGVDLATSWAYEYQDWIRDNTSGVALIQIRADPSEKDIRDYFGLEGKGSRSLLDRFLDSAAASLQGLTSPLYGGLKAREWSMRFRNASQVRVLDDIFNKEGRHDFFRTFVFENFAEFAMNWFLSEQDILLMEQSVGGPAPSDTPGPSGEADVSKKDGKATLPLKRKMSHKKRADLRESNREMKGELRDWWVRGPAARTQVVSRIMGGTPAERRGDEWGSPVGT